MSSRKEQKAEAREARLAAQRERDARDRRRRVLTLAGVAAAAIAAIVVIALVAGGGDDGSGTEQTANGDGAAETMSLYRGIPQDGTSLGDPDAPLVLTEYADLQCPFCAQYATGALPDIIEEYVRPGRLRLEMRLLRFLGPDSDRGAQAAQVAADNDRMWQFIDLWYRNQGVENTDYADEEFITGLAEDAGVPVEKALQAARTGSRSPAIEQHEQEADLHGIDSTPSFLAGPEGGRGERLEVGELSFPAFRDALEPMFD